MNRELYDRATYKGVNAASSRMLLTALAEWGGQQVADSLIAALVRPEARALAAALAEPLAAAREAAIEPLAAVDAARKALAAEKQSVHARLADFFNSPRRRDPGDREHAPAVTSPKVQELQAALAEAEAVAMPFKQRADYHQEQIDGLLRAPEPDRRVMAVLAEAMAGARIAPRPPKVNSATMATTQPVQAAPIDTHKGD